MLNPTREERAARHSAVQTMLEYLEKSQQVDILQGVAMLYTDVLEAEHLDVVSNGPFDSSGNYIGLVPEYVEEGLEIRA